MEHSQALNLQDYLAIIRRRKWYLIIPAVIGLLGGWIVLQNLPKSYEASALVIVEPPAISSDVVKSMGSTTSEDRFWIFRHEIMSRKFLEPILRELDLYGAASAGAENIEGLVRTFQDHISVESSRGAGDSRNRNIISFTVSFYGRDPQMVMDVTNKIAELFIAQHGEAVSVEVQGTTSFLESELDTLRTTLEKKEAAIAEFRRQNMGELPEQLSSNLGSRDRARQDLKAVSETLQNSVEKKASLQALLVEGKEGDTVAGRLIQLRRQLSQLRTNFKETYPDVRIMKEQIEQLEALLRDGRAAPEDSATLPGRGGEALSLQMPDLDLTIDSLKRKQHSLENEIREYDRRIDVTPRLEQEMMILMRDYENLKKSYQSLLEKRVTAMLSKKIEAEQTGGTLRLIEPAYLPTQPFEPNPQSVLLRGFLIGLGFGAVIILLLEYGEASFRKPEELERVLGLPVLAVIPPYLVTKKAPLIRKTETVLK
jgi:polysaccharide chain length determinant protein (PEP-CTERM system associated)